jgi:hypothetical protein
MDSNNGLQFTSIELLAHRNRAFMRGLKQLIPFPSTQLTRKTAHACAVTGIIRKEPKAFVGQTPWSAADALVGLLALEVPAPPSSWHGEKRNERGWPVLATPRK